MDGIQFTGPEFFIVVLWSLKGPHMKIKRFPIKYRILPFE